MNWKKLVTWGVLALVLIFLGMQLIPYGRQHDNPPVVNELDWGDPAVREVAVAACYDCHSNETAWPWYSNVAPLSWLVQNDVAEGRRVLNFSEWPPRRLERGEMAEAVSQGWMPPAYYTIMHPSARLSDGQKQALTRGLQQIAGK